MVMINEKIPDFTAEAYHEGKIKKVSLSEYAGKWVILVFYPADFTFVCPTEIEEYADHYKKFHAEQAEIITVSTDTAFVHKAWHDISKAVGKVTFPMLADPSGRICRMFGTYIEDSGLSLRGTFIIDPDGVLKTIEVHDLGIGRSALETLRKLKAARFVREHGDQVCPAGWEPGKPTLKPGMDLVGKI